MRNSKSYLVILSLMIVFVACKTTKEQEASSAPEKSIESAKVVVLTEPVKIDIGNLQMEAAKRASEDSLVMNIKRTPCYGQCPVYTADIYKSGLVVYDGKRFVTNEGLHTATMSKDDLEQIKKMAISIGYFDLEKEYDSPVTDLPTTYTTMNIQGQRKTIKNRVGGPDELKAFERHVQKVLDSLTWTAAEDSGKH